MRDGVMLYKSPGPHVVDGKSYCYLVVHKNDVDARLAEGWSRTVEDAVESERRRNEPPADEPAAPDPFVPEGPQTIADLPETAPVHEEDEIAPPTEPKKAKGKGGK